MYLHRLTVTILFVLCLGMSAQAQFKVVESSIQQGSTSVAEQGVLYLTFNAPIDTDTLVSPNPNFSFGKFHSNPVDIILDGEVTVIGDSTLAIPYKGKPNTRHVLYLFEIYNTDGEVMDPYALTFHTGALISTRTVSGTLTFPEDHDEGAIVALIPRNDYTQNMITQPLVFARAGIYVPNGETEYTIENVPTGDYFVYAFGGKKPGSEPALLNQKPIGVYDLNEDGTADRISMDFFDAQINQVDVTLEAFEFAATGTDVFRDQVLTIAEDWNPSAELIHVSALLPTNTSGESKLWLWLFHTTNGESAFGIVSSSDRSLFGFPTGLDLNFFKEVGDEWINSQEAVASAIEIESEFLANAADTSVKASLNGGLRIEFLYEKPAWSISLRTDSARKTVHLNAITGEKIMLEDITAREAFDVLNAAVLELAADAYLTTALTSFKGASGEAPVWIMEFYSALEDKFYTTSVSALENPIIFSRSNLSGRTPYQLSDEWIDSDALMDSLSNIERYPGDENMKRTELFLAPFKVPFPADTVTSWQVFAKPNDRDARPFVAIIVAETGEEYMLPTGTAKDWLASADAEAANWSDDAQLLRVNSFGGRTADENGESELWRYVYKSETLTDSVLHVFSANNDTRTRSIPVVDSILINLPVLDNVEELIDSDEAMAIAMEEDSIAVTPNIDFDFIGARMALDKVRIRPDSTIAIWSIYSPFRMLEDIGFQRIVINAETGEILRNKIRTTDRTPFEVAKSAAHEWQADARLHYVRADSVDDEGKVEVWRFIFWSRSAQQAYEIIVEGGTNIVSEQVIEELPDRFDFNRPIRRWLESVRAMLRANEFIGNQLRDAGELLNTKIELALPPSDATALPKYDANGNPNEDGSWIITFEKTDGTVEVVEVDFEEQIAVSNEEIGFDVPASFELSQNYPNPFNPSTNIQFALPQASNVQLDVFNVLGQRVATLVNNEQKQAGLHTVSFDASSLASGMYIYRIQAGSFIQTRKMMLIK